MLVTLAFRLRAPLRLRITVSLGLISRRRLVDTVWVNTRTASSPWECSLERLLLAAAQGEFPKMLRFIIGGALVASVSIGPAVATEGVLPPEKVPGVVIDHSPASSRLYIGSPSIAVLPNGDYLAAHDFFGPKSREFECPTVVVFRSADRGATWQQSARLNCLFWPNLFVHSGAVYLMGTDRHHGHIIIRRSLDGGTMWTEPRDATSGLLTARDDYHTAPVPVVEQGGRLWRAFEDASGGTNWGE
jgi:hypothetical protein